MRVLKALSILSGLFFATPGLAVTLDEFRFTANSAISGYNTEHLTSVTPEQCATACRASSRPWCKSFDYHRADKWCDLSDKRASDVGGLSAGTTYDHYNLSTRVNTPNPISGKRHLLVIGIDGLRGDAITCSGCARPATMMELINGGAFHGNALAGGSQATNSGPGWGSQFTGFWAAQHGVTSNAISQTLQKPHLFTLIKNAYPTATTAVVADWENLTQGLLPPGADFVVRNGAKASQQATDVVKDWVSWQNPPTAIFYYLHNVDVHTCCYDPANANYQSKIRSEDAQIKQVLDTMTARPNYANENWLVAIVSDHGGTGSGHGGQSAGERATALILNNTYKSSRSAYCRGTFTSTSLRQIDALTPHALSFLGIANPTDGRKLSACN